MKRESNAPRNWEQAQKRFSDAMRTGQPPARCYLLDGEEEYLKRAALEKLRKALFGHKGELSSLNETSFSDVPADEIIAAAETFSFDQSRRLMIVTDSGMLLPSGQTRSKNYDEDENADKLCAYLPNLPDTACLVFYVRGVADSRRKLYKALDAPKDDAQIVHIRFDRQRPEHIAQWIALECGKYGKKIKRDACDALLFTSGSDMTLLHGEIAKMCAYAGDAEEVTAGDVQSICTRTTEYRVFELAGALLRGDGARAFALLEALKQSGEKELGLLALLSRQCRQWLMARILDTAKRPMNEIIAQTGIPYGALQNDMPVIRAYTVDMLRDICQKCVEADYLVKSGQRSEDGAMETMMLYVLSARKGA